MVVTWWGSCPPMGDWKIATSFKLKKDIEDNYK